MDNLLGLMEEATKESSKRIRNMDLAYWSGLMEGFIKDIGKTTFNMEMVNIQTL